MKLTKTSVDNFYRAETDEGEALYPPSGVYDFGSFFMCISGDETENVGNSIVAVRSWLKQRTAAGAHQEAL